MSKTFCVQPWLGKEIGIGDKTPKVCCWIPMQELLLPETMDEIRHALLTGVKHPACKKCWDLEEVGEESRRQQRNALADMLYNKNIENIQEMCIKKGYSPSIYQIANSNICNGACIMCNSFSSSKWQSLNKDFEVINNNIQDQDIDFENAIFVEFQGGEPLLDVKILDILKKLKPECMVSIITNGNIDITPTLLDILKKFKRLTLCISIDGVGPVYEYQRWPLKWNKLVENLTKFKELNLNISVSYTITNVNLPYKHETIEWFKSEKLKYIINTVHMPKYFAVTAPISEETIQELDRQDALKGIDRRDYGFNF